MSVIILAPSLTGKSYFSARAYTKQGLRVVDGDAIVSSQGGWPKQKRWWLLPGADAVQRRTATMVAKVAHRNPDVAIVWWADLSICVPVFRVSCPSTQLLGVIPDKEKILERWRQRERLIAEGKSGHSSRTKEEVLRTWEHGREKLEHLKVAIFPSLETVAKRLEMHVSSRTED